MGAVVVNLLAGSFVGSFVLGAEDADQIGRGTVRLEGVGLDEIEGAYDGTSVPANPTLSSGIDEAAVILAESSDFLPNITPRGIATAATIISRGMRIKAYLLLF